MTLCPGVLKHVHPSGDRVMDYTVELVSITINITVDQRYTWCQGAGLPLPCSGRLFHMSKNLVYFGHVPICELLKLVKKRKSQMEERQIKRRIMTYFLEFNRVFFVVALLDTSLLYFSKLHTSILCHSLSSRSQCIASLNGRPKRENDDYRYQRKTETGWADLGIGILIVLESCL
jgi:hypothetical protein